MNSLLTSNDLLLQAALSTPATYVMVYGVDGKLEDSFVIRDSSEDEGNRLNSDRKNLQNK